MSVRTTMMPLLILSILVSCGKQKPHTSTGSTSPEVSNEAPRIEVEFENIGNEDVRIAIDSKDSFEVPALSKVKRMIPEKKNIFYLNQKDSVHLTILPGKKLLVNPTRMKLYLRSMVYGTEEVSSAGNVMKRFEDTITVGGYRAIGLYKDLGDKMLIQGFWNFGLYEDFPESFTIQQERKKDDINMTMGVRTKVYDESSLLPLIEKTYKQAITRGLRDGFSEEEIKNALGLTDNQLRRLKSI